ncbi:uncharacterized protein LOC114802328 [Denticeps clupeoides]|uniref:uncharacterized protein LOC114802328 n=1 Tax=Denticeps clupeoides TaxID=299321 RepID=UPI0010A39153|nr:uncharacterized protein LOC114802328 [Denticeps clupeoides]
MLSAVTSAASRLCQAVDNDDPRSVNLFLSQGADPNLVLEKGVAAVHLAVGRESEKGTRCLRLILQHGGDPNLRSSEGLTPLHIAALWGCYQNLRLLLKNGGDPNLRDQDGNKPCDLAEQQENSRCALLLSEYESHAVQVEVDEFPNFQYSIYSGQAGRDRSSCFSASEDCSINGLSMFSDFGDDPLSSTRRSSALNISRTNSQQIWRGHRQRIRSNVPGLHTHKWPEWDIEEPPVLSSTRMSIAEAGDASAVLPILPDDTPLNKCNALQNRPAKVFNYNPPIPSHQPSRKSVSFRDVDEYFPVFSSESPKEKPVQGRLRSRDSTVDFSDYPDFFHSERMATVLHHQGIDVTSPDHVFVFSRDGECDVEDLEKTVLGHWPSEETDEFKAPSKSSSGSGSRSSSGASQYGSCESDQYTSAFEASTFQTGASPLKDNCEDPLRNGLLGERACFQPGNSQGAQRDFISVTTGDIKRSVARISDMIDNLVFTENVRPCQDPMGVNRNIKRFLTGSPETSSGLELGAEEQLSCEASTSTGTEIQNEHYELKASPFVTGRTRSRLSRCSVRTSHGSPSLSASGLFEQTLPTAARMQRRTLKSQDNTPVQIHDPSPHCRTARRECPPQGQKPFVSCEEGSQADTLIISGSMADTFILEKGSVEQLLGPSGSSERKPLDKGLKSDVLVEVHEYITDDLTSLSETGSREVMKSTSSQEELIRASRTDVEHSWLTDEDSKESYSSVSSAGTPRKNAPASPASGCTPRYSMSRLSGHQKPQSLANLSYTPGGRPLIVDTDEPVEYLYTDTAAGHELIETHVPPTSNTSISSNISTSTSDDTVLYDWRSLTSPVKEKENVKPCEETPGKGKGMTDKALRRQLVELGEEPGPINSRTRPLYIRKLRQLQQGSTTSKQSLSNQCNANYGVELTQALNTFILPDCSSDELALCEQFDHADQNKRWREGIIKSSFNYLLLDPRVTNNLPYRSRSMSPKECFQTFISAIFYIGKGKRSRPYSHLYEALEYYKGDKTAKKLCSKVQHILQVWNADQGVISLHCFQNVIPVEAYTREACMVDAIGLKMLTNQKRGDYYGVVSTWSAKKKRELGVHLLYRAMQIFLAEGERQLRPADIRAGH